MVFYADFETSTHLIDNRTNVYLWGLINETNTFRAHDVNLDSFIETLENEKTIPIVYFHNISWDGMFLVHYFIDKGYNFVQLKNYRAKMEIKTFSWICDNQGTIYRIIVQTEKQKIIFLDSYKLLLSSVEGLGKILNLPKLKIDYDEYEHFDKKEDLPEVLVEYLYRDIEVVMHFMQTLYKKIPKVKTTLASTSYNMFIDFYGRNNFYKDFGSYKISPLMDKEWEFAKDSYRGGLTLTSPLWNEKLIELKNTLGHSYDVNSLYPFVMETNRMPYGQPFKNKKLETDICLVQIKILNAYISSEFLPAVIPNNNKAFFNGNYLREVKDLTINVWENELKIWEKFYDMKYIVLDRLYFHTKFVFKEFIEKIKTMKIEAPNEVERFIAKILQNSLYGKFGENYIKLSKILVYDISHNLRGKRYGEKQDWVEQQISTEEEYKSYIPMASYITALARCKLMKAIYENKENFLYCDTDSLYLKDVAKGIEVDDKLYGCWKQEHLFMSFKSLKPKCYMLQDIRTMEYYIKVAGLPAKAQKLLNFNNFYKGYQIEDAKLQKKTVIGGLILSPIIYTL